MFTPIKVQRQQQKPQRRGAGTPDLRALRDPVGVGALSVQRFRALVSEHGGVEQQTDPVFRASNDARHNHELAQMRLAAGASKSPAAPAPTPAIAAAAAAMATPQPQDQQQQQQQQRQQQQQQASILVADLAALTGGAPVSRLFVESPSHLNLSAISAQRVRDENANEASHSPDATTIGRGDESPQQQQQQRQKFLLNADGGDRITTATGNKRHARFLQEELSLRLEHSKQQSATSPTPKSQAQQSQDYLLAHDTVMHCRELGHKLADALGARSAYGPVVRQLIEILAAYGEQQHEAATRHLAKCEALTVELSDMTALAEFHENAAAAAAAASGGKGRRRKQQQHFLKSPGTASLENASFGSFGSMSNLELGGDADDYDPEAERRKVAAQLIEAQGELAQEREAAELLKSANVELKKKLDAQFEAGQEHDEAHREAMRETAARCDELEQRFRVKNGEVKGLRDEIKALEIDLEEKLWLGTIESTSTDVAMKLLRKHCKDCESRAATAAMRLRQEQELVLKLKRKLADSVEKIDDLLLEEYLDGAVPTAPPTTPRPDKEHLVRSVPALGRAQAQASTAQLVDGLVVLVRTQEERLRAEARSWEEAQREADRILDERRCGRCAEAGTQTEEQAEEE